MKLRRDERGQSAVLAVVFLAALLGMSAAVVDVGSWFRADRRAQATADAAALAGAQGLPDPTSARTLALDYASRNGDTLNGGDIALSSTVLPNDTIKVSFQQPAPGFFSKVLGISSVQVGATAAARAFKPGDAKYVAPVAVNLAHPKLSGPGCPCFGPGNQTTLPLDKAGAPGAFYMLVLDQGMGKGGVGPSTLADWILNGFADYLPVDSDYYSDPGAKFNSSQIKSALDARIGTDLLFPVYDTLDGNGANAQYHVVAWAAFHLTGYEISGKGSISGYFTKTIWEGLEPTTGGDPPDLGVRSVELVQ